MGLSQTYRNYPSALRLFKLLICSQIKTFIKILLSFLLGHKTTKLNMNKLAKLYLIFKLRWKQIVASSSSNVAQIQDTR